LTVFERIKKFQAKKFANQKQKYKTMVVSSAAYQLYSRPFDERLLKKRLPKLTASYNTVRLLDYLEEKQKLKTAESYMFAKHSTTPWYSQNFYDSNSLFSVCFFQINLS